jgi:hypothetical protein
MGDIVSMLDVQAQPRNKDQAISSPFHTVANQSKVKHSCISKQFAPQHAHVLVLGQESCMMR